jgi:hypothetical protein
VRLGVGASVPDQALAVPVEPVARLDPTGFDPSRVCPECRGAGWIEVVEHRCCQGPNWECGAEGCTGARIDYEQEPCEWCQTTGHDRVDTP